jgi:aminopeptidase YwaD
LTALLAALALAGASPGHDALAVARQISSAGPRPAASRAEGRAHVLMARRFRRAGLRVVVQRFHVRGRGGSRNVIGVLDTPHGCLRIVMAHTDSMPAAPGANDNGSGIGVLAALAPRLRAIKPGCDVWLVATGAEERLYTGSPDHLGALALAKRVRARGLKPRLRFALSLDEVGRGAGFWLRSPVRAPRRGVERRLTGPRVRWVRDEGSGNSDHREFQLLGMPGMKLGVAGDEPCRHKPCDRANRLQPGAFSLAIRLVELALKPG